MRWRMPNLKPVQNLWWRSSRARSYRDVDLLFAIGLSFVALLFAFGPVLVALDWLPLNLSILFAVSWVFSAHTVSAATRALDPDGAAGKEKGQQHFLNQGVGQTRGRTGILVLISQLERRVEVVADSGVIRAVDADRWQALLKIFKRGMRDRIWLAPCRRSISWGFSG